MKKRSLILSLLLVFLLFIGIFSVNAAIMHSASNFMIKVKDTTGTLQNAIDGGYFTDFTNTYSQPSSILNPGHGASEIWVSVKDGEMNLLQALSSTNKLCSNPSKPTTYTSSPTDKTKPYHYATEIQLTSGKTFQQAINDGDFCCVPTTCANLGYNCGTPSDGCGGTLNCGTCTSGVCSNNNGGVCTGVCTPGGTKTKYCDDLDTTCRNYNAVTDTCKSDGTWTNPPCDSYTNAAKGTTPCDGTDTKACDGSGSCLEWFGKGRDSCPWGYGSYSCPDGTCYYCKLEGNQGRYYTGEVWSQWSYAEKSAVSSKYYKYCKVRIIICLDWEKYWVHYDWQIKP